MTSYSYRAERERERENLSKLTDVNMYCYFARKIWGKLWRGGVKITQNSMTSVVSALNPTTSDNLMKF